MAQKTHTPFRITLVVPPFQYFPGMKTGADPYTRPPLGIAYLAAFLKAHFKNDVTVDLVDCAVERLFTKEQAARRILANSPHLVGFSVVTGTVNSASLIACAIKKQNPSIRTVAGGPHVTALPDEPLPGMDAKIFGEGERSFLEYVSLRCLAKTTGPLAGLIEFENDKIISKGPARPFIEDLDLIPIPARELLPSGVYFHSYPYPNAKNFTTLFTSRGCPFDCAFCGNRTLWNNRVRFHSLERVYEEIDRIVFNGTSLVFFDDDTFTCDHQRVLGICDYVRRRHPSLRWICHARADTLEKNLLDEMKSSGCVEIQIGVESGDPEILRRMDKRMDLESARRAFYWLKKAKLNSWATFILGNDGETPETIQASIAFAKEIDPTYCTFIVLLPFPGTLIYEKYKRLGHITTFDWSRYSWHSHPVISLDALSDADLVAWRRRAFSTFYLRPGKLARIAFDVGRAFSRREIMRNFRAWLAVVSS